MLSVSLISLYRKVGCVSIGDDDEMIMISLLFIGCLNSPSNNATVNWLPSQLDVLKLIVFLPSTIHDIELINKLPATHNTEYRIK